MSHKINGVTVSLYAFAEAYAVWDTDNELRLDIKGLAANSFMGAYIAYPGAVPGIVAEERIFPERYTPSRLHYDPSLLINSFTVTPADYNAKGDTITVKVKTTFPRKIENVYFIILRSPLAEPRV